MCLRQGWRVGREGEDGNGEGDGDGGLVRKVG